MDASSKRFFQYIGDDETQLHSNVVRAYRQSHSVDEPFEGHVLGGEVDFHAHVFLVIGLKQRVWQKVGHGPVRDDLDILFRDSGDYGNPKIKVSRNWYIWRINGPQESVGELRPKYQSAEIGVVVPPNSLVYRMRHGRYDFVYPEYEPATATRSV